MIRKSTQTRTQKTMKKELKTKTPSNRTTTTSKKYESPRSSLAARAKK